MESCKICKFSRYKRKYTKKNVFCKKHSEVKSMADICEDYKKRGFGAAIYDFVIFLLMTI